MNKTHWELILQCLILIGSKGQTPFQDHFILRTVVDVYYGPAGKFIAEYLQLMG